MKSDLQAGISTTHQGHWEEEGVEGRTGGERKGGGRKDGGNWQKSEEWKGKMEGWIKGGEK